MTDPPLPPSGEHPHIADAPELRRYLLDHHGSDYGADDNRLAAEAERARVYLAFTGYKWSWQSVAANAIVLAAKGRL